MAGEFVAGAIVSKILLSTKKWGDSVTKVNSDTKKMGGMSEATSKKFKKMGAGMTIAGAVIIGATTKMLGKFVDLGDEVDKMSKRTGISTTALSELAHAADISGTTLNDVEKGVKKMSKSLVDADLGLETYTRSFDRLGLSVVELMKMKPEDQFMVIGEALAGLESDTLRAATAQEIFGRAGMNLIPMFKEGEDGIRFLREEAHRLGIVFDEEMAASAAKLKDEQTRLKQSFQGVGITLATTLAPAISAVVEKITGMVTKITAWAKENPKLAGTILKVVVGLGGLLTVLGPMVMIIPKLIGGVKGLAVGIKVVGVAMKTALGPIGLVTVAIVAAGVALNSWINAKKRAMDVEMDAMVADKSLGDALKLRRKLIEENIITQEEWTTLVNKHGKDYKAVFNAIATDPSLGKYKDALVEIQGSEEDAKDAAEDLGEGVSLMDQALKGVGETIDELETPFDNFTLQQFQLADAFADGEIGMGQYVKRMADLREEREKNLELFDEEEFAIDDAIEGIEGYVEEWESVPSALESVMQGIGIEMEDSKTEIEKHADGMTTNVKNKWGDMTDGMITDWSQALGDFIKSGDIFKGDFKGLMDGVLDIFTDTLGNMLTMFITDFVGGIMSGASDAASGILSSLGSALGGGGDGAGGLASGVNSLVGGISSLANPVNMISGAVTAIASVITALQGPGGPSTTDSWNFDHIQMNTKELRDYTFLNIGSSSGWLAKIYDRNTDTFVALQTIRKLTREKVNKNLDGIYKDTTSMAKNIGKMPGLLKDISKTIGTLSGAQEGHRSTKPELVMVHGTPQDPEFILRESQLRALGGSGGGGGSQVSIVMENEMNLNGTMLSDREYMRSRLFPEFISMLKANFGQSQLKSLLGVA